MSKTKSVLVWLEWPEACFRANECDIAYLREIARCDVVWVHSEEEFLSRLPEATHAITWHFKAGWYSIARNLRVLATPAAGRELLAWREAPPGIAVHFGAYHGEIIAESVAAFCLGWARGFFRKPPATGIWPRQWLGDKCFTVAGTQAVIAGYGRIGKAVGKKLSALGIGVRGIGRSNIADLPDAFAQADWLILALPSDTGTDDFLDERRIAMLPPCCAVVNVGRGNAVDEDALFRALREGRIAAAYLDVFKNEPTALNPDATTAPHHGEEPPPNLVAMPHSSAFAPDYVRRCFKELCDEGLL